MKSKIILFAFTLMLAVSTTLDAAPTTKKAIADKVLAMTAEQKEARIASIKQRVEFIKAMDKSQLSKGERKALRHELKSMSKEAKALSGGVYLSVGAIIIIILLLILIL